MITIGEVKRVMNVCKSYLHGKPELHVFTSILSKSERIEKTSSLGISFSLYEQFGSYPPWYWSWQSKLC